MRQSEIRRMVEPKFNGPTVSQEELDIQVAEYLARGGEVTKVPQGVTVADYSTPGGKENYGKNLPVIDTGYR